MTVGGKFDQLHGVPVSITGRVRLIHDGEYIEHEIRHGGKTYQPHGLDCIGRNQQR